MVRNAGKHLGLRLVPEAGWGGLGQSCGMEPLSCGICCYLRRGSVSNELELSGILMNPAGSQKLLVGEVGTVGAAPAFLVSQTHIYTH